MRIAALLLVVAASAQAQDATLKGIRTVYVPEPTTSAEIPSGALVGGLKTSLELELRKAGITVLARDTSLASSGDVRLAVSAVPIRYSRTQENLGHAFFVEVSVWRWVFGAGGSDTTAFFAPVWSDSHIGIASDAASFRSLTAEAVTRLSQSAANALLAARNR